MTHQQILDQRRDIASRHERETREMNDRHVFERGAIKAQCARIGHLFGEGEYYVPRLPTGEPRRRCVICGSWEPQ